MDFDLYMNPNEFRACISLKSIIMNFLGNYHSVEYEIVMNKLMLNYQHLGSRMSKKMHFINSHIDYFPNNWRFWQGTMGTFSSICFSNGRTIPK